MTIILHGFCWILSCAHKALKYSRNRNISISKVYFIDYTELLNTTYNYLHVCMCMYIDTYTQNFIYIHIYISFFFFYLLHL